MTHMQKKEVGNRNFFWRCTDSGISKDFTTSVMHMFKELKKTMLKEIKADMRMAH